MRTQLLRSPKPLPFPLYLWMSRNHYHRGWSLKSLRRIKNVIIALEWVPDWDHLGLETVCLEPSDHAMKLLDRACKCFDYSGCAGAEPEEVRDILQALDVGPAACSAEAVAALLEELNEGVAPKEVGPAARNQKERKYQQLVQKLMRQSLYQVRGRDAVGGEGGQHTEKQSKAK